MSIVKNLVQNKVNICVDNFLTKEREGMKILMIHEGENQVINF